MGNSFISVPARSPSVMAATVPAMWARFISESCGEVNGSPSKPKSHPDKTSLVGMERWLGWAERWRSSVAWVSWAKQVFQLTASSQLAESLARGRVHFQRDGKSTQAQSNPSHRGMEIGKFGQDARALTLDK